ncbi:putative F-box protein [Rosa sericea]
MDSGHTWIGKSGGMNKCPRRVTSSDSEWALSLNVDVAFVILDKLLEPIDHVHFAAICKLWHSFAKHYNHTTRRWPKLLPPMLILPGDQDLIYSLSEGKVYHKINLAMPHFNYHFFRRYYACGNGWLATMHYYGQYSNIQLLNPFTRATRDLSCRGWRFGRSTKLEQGRMIPKREQAPKLILFGDPSVNGDNSFMVVAFYTTDSTLGFIRGGQSFWSSIETMEQYAITDAIFYKGQVYAVDKNLGRIVSFDVKTCTSGNSLKAKILTATYMRSSSQSYLVESTKGELLHVRRFLKVQREWGQLTMPVTLTFKVYKLVFDDNGYVVQQVELKTLGDETLFVGDNQSMSVLASSFSWCRPNSIYYTSDSITVEDDYRNFNSCCQCDMGIFNLEEGTTTPLQCYPQHSSEEYRLKPATWILPPINGLC